MKKIPLRKCTGCGEMKPKRELIRVVKSPDKRAEDGSLTEAGGVLLDLTGKKAGRGAYVCRNAACFENARRARRLERSLSCRIPDEVYDKMTEELESVLRED
ncbi:MAG: YlxR family protein [Ruminococcus sp.]|nr:YlxR family protein [Ruminococcus sp.]